MSETRLGVSHHQLILDRLVRGESLTTIDMHNMGVYGAPARIMELKRSGWNIVSEWFTDRKANGRKGKFARYSLFNPKQD
jgi:Helix-turn-helix domain